VGKTTTSLYTRFANHKSDIKQHGTTKSKNLPMGRHFNLPNHSFDDVSIQGIEQIRNKNESIILKRESFWMLKLQTLTPKGINVDE
jgi:hypothetical protein